MNGPVKIIDWYGSSALEVIAIGITTLLALLLKTGAKINAPAAPRSGATALQLAAQFGGRVTLEGASEHGHLDIVQLLLETGVSLVGAMRVHFVRAVGYTKCEGHFAVAKLLQEPEGWAARDQELYERENILSDQGYFVFDADRQD
ncbi:hypothetical protein F4782DRAFT_535597 [Xylaria castorea]|nr:hypothetical protein F4782DRAFT_535597 [Xylaria castorea]